MDDIQRPVPVRSAPLDPEQIRLACESPLAYLAILHRYLDGGLSGLGAPAQRVFLQLVKESLSRGRRTVRITVRQLAAKTGLSKDTISVALRHLVSPEVDLVNTVSPGSAHAPAQYEIRWSTYEKVEGSAPPVRRRLRAKTIHGSIENRLAELSPEDRSKLEISYLGLQPHERREMEERVLTRLQELGITVDTPTFQQLVLFEVMRSTMYHHIQRHYPTAFTFHPVK